MPTYIYTARNQQGQEQHGIKESKDEHALAEFLKTNNLILTSLKEKKQLSGLGGLDLWRHVSVSDKMFFTQHLEVMVRAGVPLMGALNVLSEQTNKKFFRQTILDVRDDIEKGSTLAEAMGKHKKIFGDLYINMVNVGEISGNLEEVLRLLSTQIKKEKELLTKVRGALVYPSIILLIMIGVGLIMLFYVMPKLFVVFEELQVPLPFLTQMFINISKFLIAQWWIMPVGAGVIGISIWLSRSVPQMKNLWNFVIFHLPLVGKLIKKMNIGRVTRTLNSLLQSGVPIVKALNTVSGTVSNKQYQDSLKQAAEAVEKGETLSRALSGHKKLYPVLVVQMIKIGEETGNLTQLLEETAEFYESQVNEASKNLSTIIEPFLMVLIGAAIGFFAVAMIQPMYSIMNAI